MPVRLDEKAKTWFYRFMRGKEPFYRGGFRTKRQAEDAESRRKDDLIRQEICPEPVGSDLTLHDAAQWFFDEYSLKQKRDWMGDRAKVRFMQEFFQGKLLRQVSPADVQSMREVMVSKGYSKLTVNHYQAALKAIYNRASKFGKYVGPNPARQVEMAKVPKARVRFLYPAEEKQLTPMVRAWKGGRLWPYYLLDMSTGMRLRELCGIRVKDVSMMLGQIFLGHTKTNRGLPRLTPIFHGPFAVKLQWRFVGMDEREKARKAIDHLKSVLWKEVEPIAEFCLRHYRLLCFALVAMVIVGLLAS